MSNEILLDNPLSSMRLFGINKLYFPLAIVDNKFTMVTRDL